MIWRIATNKKFSDSYISICHEWTIQDLLHAHEVLDIQEELEKEAIEQQTKDSK